MYSMHPPPQLGMLIMPLCTESLDYTMYYVTFITAYTELGLLFSFKVCYVYKIYNVTGIL